MVLYQLVLPHTDRQLYGNAHNHGWSCTIWLYRPSTLTYSLTGLRLQLAYFCWSLKLNSASALAVVHPEQTHDPCPPIACNSKGSQPGNIHSDSKRPSVLQGESNFSKFINERIVQPGPGAIKAWSWCQSMPGPGANQCLVLVPINAWSWCQSMPGPGANQGLLATAKPMQQQPYVHVTLQVIPPTSLFPPFL